MDNHMYGFCYEHGRHHDLEFTSYDSVSKLADLVEAGELHVAKECMVAVVSNNSVNQNTQIALVWPTCSKSETDVQRAFIVGFSKAFFEKTGAPLKLGNRWCWGTSPNF